MQLQLLSIVLILHCIEYTGCQQHTSRHRQHKPLPGVCQGGCLTCSDYNGCLSCKPRFFIFLERNGMRQIGVCLLSCPSGFYGTRSPDRNICTKCGPECDSCFNKNFCMRCRAGYYLHQGKCQENCPEGLVRSDTQRECVSSCPAECETCTNSDTCTRCKSTFYLQQGQCARVCSEGFEPNDKLMECTHQVHCEVSEWSEWSPCSNSGRTCGFKWGEETRIRKVVLHPSHLGQPCPRISETKECILKKRRCSGGKRKAERRGERRNRNNRRDKEGNEGRRERKREKEQERERDTGDREDSEKRNKTEHRRRRGKNIGPVSPSPTQ